MTESGTQSTSGSTRRPRQLPRPAPAQIVIGELVADLVDQSPDMVRYVTRLGGERMDVFVMAAFDSATTLPADGILRSRRSLLVTDRDGVLKTSAFVNTTDRAATAASMIPTAVAAGRRLEEADIALVIATNQGGYQSGYMDFDDTVAVNVRVAEQMVAGGGRVDAVLICPFAEPLPNPSPGAVDARKPAGGMPLYARKMAEEAGIPTLAMVGDQRTDGAAGQSAGLKFYAVTDADGRWSTEATDAAATHRTLPVLDTHPAHYEEVPSFADVVDAVLGGDTDAVGKAYGVE